MKIVVDANIIFKILLGSRANYVILTSMNYTFYSPEFIIGEIRKYIPQIAQMKNVSEQEITLAFADLLFFLTVLPYEEYSNCLSKAMMALEDRDRKDVDYLACALAIEADLIWTEDDDFSSQNLVPTKTTTEFLDS